jgi:hypothetical protein
MKRHWEVVINEELQSLASNNVWKIVDTPKGANVVTNKWVLKVKRLPDGRTDRYKARLVARGFSQQYGVHYDETFAPVVRVETVRILLVIAATEGLEIYQMDVITAYLAGELEGEIYMVPPPGVPGTEGLVCRLLKGLHGPKQSARVWNQRLTSELKRMWLRATTADPSVWVDKDRRLILAIYRNDSGPPLCQHPLGPTPPHTLGTAGHQFGLRHRYTRSVYIDLTVAKDRCP